MSTLADINGNIRLRGPSADRWLRRNIHRLTEATIDGADCPLLMVTDQDGRCYRRRCETVSDARHRAERVGLELRTDQRGTDFDINGNKVGQAEVTE
jgi:hypothetical protein